MTSVYIGLDYGEKTVGVALSSPSGLTAYGHGTLRRKEPEAFKPLMKSLKEIIRENNVTHIVLGMPYNLDKEEGARAQATLLFRDKLTRHFKNKPVILWDERFSTRAAGRACGSKSHIDEMAAVCILQGYLEKKDMEEKMNENMLNEDGLLHMVDDAGEEHAVEILATKEIRGEMLAIVAKVDESDDSVDIIKFVAIDKTGENFDIEIVDEEHENREEALMLFQADFEELGIDVEEE